MSMLTPEPGGEARAVPCLRLVQQGQKDINEVLRVLTSWPDLTQRQFLGELRRQTRRSEYAELARSILEAACG